MESIRLFRVFKQRIPILILLLVMVPTEVQSIFCRPNCRCVFSDEKFENIGICELGNSSVTITWKNDLVTEPLLITCQGTNYTCADLPQFDINEDTAEVHVKTCAPKILKCLNNIYSKPTVISNLELYDMLNSYNVDDFKGLSQLSFLRLHLSDDVTEIPMEIINSLHKLQSIAIVGGNIQLYANMFNKTSLYEIILEDNNIKKIPDDIFNSATLEKLEIDKNHMEDISAATFRGASLLRRLSMKDNKKLKSIDPKAFVETPLLVSFDLDGNALESLHSDLLNGLYILSTVTIKHNLVEMTLSAPMHLGSHFYKLTMADSKIKILPENIFYTNIGIGDIDLSYNKIEILPPKLFWRITSLMFINLKGNQLKVIPKGLFSQLYNLQEIDLSNNYIMALTGDVFTSGSLRKMWLDGNNITVLDLKVFDGSSLDFLSVASNQIHRIIANASSVSLTLFNLSHNNVDMFDSWLIESTELKRKSEQIVLPYAPDLKLGVKIDLRYNHISYINIDNTDWNVLLTNEFNIYLYLSNNPLQCDCSMSTFLKQLYTAGALRDFDNITCTNHEHISKIDPHILCNNTLISTIGSSAVGALVIILFLVAICTYCRNNFWKKVRHYLNFNEDNLKTNRITMDVVKPYDLFLSFAYQDDDFVLNKLLPKLEIEFSQKVCMHYRDWIAGDFIPDQIVKSVEDSKMTVIILTEHFLTSDWSYLEFHTAHNMSKQEKKSKVIIIVLDKDILQDPKMPADLKSYIVVNRYLTWGECNFWEKLQKMLPGQYIKRK